MTRNLSLFIRVLFFFAGAGVIVLAFFLTMGGQELSRIDAFVWISIGLMYLIFSLPFFFSAIRIENFSGKIPALSMVWLGIILYCAASIAVIVMLVRYQIISLNQAIVIQSVLLFIFLINLYFAYFAASHVRGVAAEEAVKQQYIKQLKPKAQVLSLSVGKLPLEYEKAQKILKQAIEDIRYIYPVDGGAGGDLEQQIMQSLNNISQLCGGVSAGMPSVAKPSPVSLETESEKLRMLVKERKMLRN
jgi:hypothetical protein